MFKNKQELAFINSILLYFTKNVETSNLFKHKYSQGILSHIPLAISLVEAQDSLYRNHIRLLLYNLVILI